MHKIKYLVPVLRYAPRLVQHEVQVEGAVARRLLRGRRGGGGREQQQQQRQQQRRRRQREPRHGASGRRRGDAGARRGRAAAQRARALLEWPPLARRRGSPGPARPGPPLPSAETEVGQRGPAAARRRGPVVVRAPRALLCSPAGTGRPVYLPGSLSRAGSGGVQPCEGPRGMGFKGLGESLCPVGLWRCWYEVACS